MSFTYRRGAKFNPCKCVRHHDEDDVQPGLALTPREIGELTRAGVPLSPVNAMNFHDGYRTLDFTPGILNRRGVDLIDAWDAQQTVRKNLSKAAKAIKSSPSAEGGE